MTDTELTSTERRIAGSLKPFSAPCVAALGTFDGVHAGHRAVLANARSHARERGLLTVAVTFSPRPESVLSPAEALPDICCLEERCGRLRSAGADEVAVIEFTPRLARLDGERFLGLLVSHLEMKAISVGEDFSFGRGASCDVQRIRELGIEVIATPLVPGASPGEKASSSAVRRAIAGGVSPGRALLAA